jgi:hypothetical protein
MGVRVLTMGTLPEICGGQAMKTPRAQGPIRKRSGCRIQEETGNPHLFFTCIGVRIPEGVARGA